ncbi:MAG TPA: hypothetical protein VLT62_31565 [Candidatus Methylomirabilis sp.]|nr:hypothetical protein [Candidatus Methylomirabilis sp.]
MARSLWVFNLFLAVLALALVWVLVDLLADRRPAASGPDAAGSGQQAAAQASEADAPAPLQAPVPPLSDFDDILAKDAFKSPFAAVPNLPPAPPPPPLPPLPSLIGTIFVGEERQAILSSNNRTEIFTVGQTVAGGTLVRIEADRVAIERGSTTSEILLKTSLRQVSPAVDPGQVESGPARPEEVAPRPLPLRQGYRGGQPKQQPQQGVQPRQGVQFH